MLDFGADELIFGKTKVARTNFVANTNRAGRADGHDGFGNAVKHGIDRGAGGQRLRDSRFHFVVVLIDQTEQFDKV